MKLNIKDKQLASRIQAIQSGKTNVRHIQPAPCREELRAAASMAALTSPGVQGTTMAGKPLGSSLEAQFKEMLAGMDDAERLKARDDLYRAAASADAAVSGPARRDLMGLRIEQINNFALAPANFLSAFFEVKSLAPEDRPAYQNVTMQETKISYIGGDGRADEVKVQRDDEETVLTLRMLGTDEVRFRKVDINRGMVADASKATLILGHDMAGKQDDLCKALLFTKFSAFVTTGTKVSRTYLPHSRLNTSNLPTTNDLDVWKSSTSVGRFVASGGTLSGGSKSTAFGFHVLTAIKDYAMRWAGAFEDGDLAPTGRVFLPPEQVVNITEGIVPSGATRNEIADKLMQAGWASFTWLGITWTLIPDSTLDPASTYCYPEFNKKPGTVFLKPAFDKEMNSAGDFETEKRNEERMCLVKPFLAYIPEHRRIFAARFNYAPA